MTSTTEVRKGHGFDVGRLHTFLTARLPGYKGPLRVRQVWLGGAVKVVASITKIVDRVSLCCICAQFGFGQSNPTFLLDTPTNRYVLRKKVRHYQHYPYIHVHIVGLGVHGDLLYCTCGGKLFVQPPGHNIKTAHAVDREARVMSALHAADVGVPVPQVHVLCTDDTVIGTAFYVME